MRTEFSKDFKNLTGNENFEGLYDQSKNAFRV